MNTQARILNRVSNELVMGDAEDSSRFLFLRRSIPGWTTELHQIFFKAVLAEPSIKRVLVCGVYHGLDLAIMQGLLDTHHPGREVQLVGVDLFSAEPCADWPDNKRSLTWEQAFGCAPPSIEAARRNCPKAQIIACHSVAYLETHASDFDVIFLDSSHDFETVSRELEHARVAPIVAGDDYTGPAEWGVDRAVSSFLPDHAVLFDRIWVNAPSP